ncbi:MAG TPA: extracellular solute-binding protein [Spirochaetia bacterium]|nr:extracellular solute-binding protein [Spirochaetia bacterium]
MRRTRIAMLLAVALSLTGAIAAQADVTITYWQYFYESKVNLMNDLIQKFEAQNPGITVEQVTFPYESYQQKVAAAIPAGEGPDVINLFYGWLPLWVKSGYLQALPAFDFSSAYFARSFYPFVAPSVNIGGQNYAVPTAVRTLALIYNKRLFREAGLDPNSPPRTLDELVTDARKLSKYDAQGNLVQSGLLMQPNGQGHVWLREVLFRQFGAVPYSADSRTVTYNSPAGLQAFQWYMDRITKDKVGYPNFSTDDVTAFTAQKAAMNIDGSFRIATLNAVKNLEWGVAELPTYKGIKSNFASFWANAITSGVSGQKLDAAVKFLKFLTSPEVQEVWLQKVGELPATPSLSDEYKTDPVVSVFLKGLAYAHATSYVDEAGQRTILVDAVDQVNLKKADPAAVLKDSAAKEQKLIDDFWK